MKTTRIVSALLIILTAGAVTAQMPAVLMSDSGTNVTVRDVESSLNALRDEIAALKRSLEKDIEALRTQVATMNKQIGDRSGLSTPFNTIERRLTDLERKMKELETELRRLDSRLQRLESKR